MIESRSRPRTRSAANSCSTTGGSAGTAAALVATGSSPPAAAGAPGARRRYLVHQPRHRRPGRDRGGCTEAANGAVHDRDVAAPRNADRQREQLVRRLAAHDSSIDLMSLDPPFAPELAQAGFLAPVPADVAVRASARTSSTAPLAAATWNDKLVAVPFWANTQLLWYRKSVAQKAGLDMTPAGHLGPADQGGAGPDGSRSAPRAARGVATVWINALVESAGGHIIAKNSTDPDKIQLGLDTPAGQRAAQVMRRRGHVRRRRAGLLRPRRRTPAPPPFEGSGRRASWSTGPTSGRRRRRRSRRHASTAVANDNGWALYPETGRRGHAVRAAVGGINLGVAHFSRQRRRPTRRRVHHQRREPGRLHRHQRQPGRVGRRLRRPGDAEGFPMADPIRAVAARRRARAR